MTMPYAHCKGSGFFHSQDGKVMRKEVSYSK